MSSADNPLSACAQSPGHTVEPSQIAGASSISTQIFSTAPSRANTLRTHTNCSTTEGVRFL